MFEQPRSFYIYSVILSVIILPTSWTGGIFGVFTATQEEVQVDEYAVYSSLLTKVYVQDVAKDQRFDLLVIKEQTSLQDSVVQDLTKQFAVWKKDVPSLATETMNDLRAKNDLTAQLRPFFEIPMAYRIVTEEQLKDSAATSNPLDAWREFYRKYPKSSGLIGISRVGFNRERNQALVYLERSCGPSCADGRIGFLTREKEGWFVRHIFIVWVA